MNYVKSLLDYGPAAQRKRKRKLKPKKGKKNKKIKGKRRASE